MCCRKRWTSKACSPCCAESRMASIRCLAVDTPVPSQFAHELLNANPYAFLDEAGLEERRTRAVSLRMRPFQRAYWSRPASSIRQAIDTVRDQCWPDIRDEHELHDLLMSLVALPLAMIESGSLPALGQIV